MAVQIYNPLSFWMQLASLFFSLSGISGDLLIVRFCLFLAYLMLFLNAALGSPLWPDASSLGGIALDSLLWSLVGMYVHGTSLLCLLADERRVVDLTDDQAALWRLFYRTGGLSERLFREIVAPNMQVVELDANQVVDTESHFYIIYKGTVRLQVVSSSESDGDHPVFIVKREVLKRSGEMFDLKHLDMFSDDISFFTDRIVCTTTTRAKLFRFNRGDTKRIAHHILAKGVWQSLLINNLSFVLEAYESKLSNSPSSATTATATSDAELGGNAVDDDSDLDYCDKIFAPLQEWEKPKHVDPGSGSALRWPVAHLSYSFRRHISLPWPLGSHPTGLRQTQLPPPLKSPTLSVDDRCSPFPRSRFHTTVTSSLRLLHSKSRTALRRNNNNTAGGPNHNNENNGSYNNNANNNNESTSQSNDRRQPIFRSPFWRSSQGGCAFDLETGNNSNDEEDGGGANNRYYGSVVANH